MSVICHTDINGTLKTGRFRELLTDAIAHVQLRRSPVEIQTRSKVILTVKPAENDPFFTLE